MESEPVKKSTNKTEIQKATTIKSVGREQTGKSDKAIKEIYSEGDL